MGKMLYIKYQTKVAAPYMFAVFRAQTKSDFSALLEMATRMLIAGIWVL